MSNFLDRYDSYFVHYPFVEKDHKRICDAFDGGYYTSLSKYHEAVIRTERYAKILKDKFEYLMSFASKDPQIENTLLNFLNIQFQSHIIVFKSTGCDADTASLCGIEEMRCNPMTKEIQVLINNNFKNKFYDKDFELLENFYELICHELVHRGKALLSNFDSLQKEFKKFIDGKKNIRNLNISDKEKIELDIKLYLSRKDEIMAYANQIVQEMRFNGCTDKYIIDHAKRFDISDQDAFPIKNYYEYFKKDDPKDYKVFRELFSSIIKYVIGEEKHDFII